MFPMQRTHSSSSTSSTNSSLSLSPSGWSPSRPAISPPTMTTTPFPPSSPIAPYHLPVPATRSSRFTPRSQPEQPETFCPLTGHGSYAYPCWPAGDSLSSSDKERRRKMAASSLSSPTTHSPTSHGYAPPSSRVSDEDLASLDFSRPSTVASRSQHHLDTLAEAADDGAGCVGISWSQVGCGAPSLAVDERFFERRRRLAPPPAGALIMQGERRRSSKGSKRRQA